MNYYDILGITSLAGEAEIKKAYRQMIIAFHPDKYQGDKQFAAQKSREIIEAYEVLHHPATRRKYDALINQQDDLPAGHYRKRESAQPSHKYKQPKDSLYTRYQNMNVAMKAAIAVAGILFVVFVILFFMFVLLSAARM